MQDLQGIGPRKSSQKKYASVLLRTAVAFGAMGLVFWNIEWNAVKAVFSQMNGWVFLEVLAIYMVGQLVLAVRWLILVRALGIELKVASAVKLHFIGLFYNNAMPSAIGGDVLRAWYVSKHTDKRVEAVLSVFVDRAMGLLGILLMAFFSYSVLLKGLGYERSVDEEASGPPLSGLFVKVVLLCAAVLVFVSLAMLLSPAVRRWGKRAWNAVCKETLILAKKGRDVFGVYWKRPKVLVATLALTLLLQSATIWSFWLLGQDLGIEAGIRYYFVIFPGMWVVGALPISIAGVGVLEGGIAFLFGELAQVPLAQGTCLSLCQRLIWLLSSIPGGIVHLMGCHVPETFSFDEGQGQG